MSYKLFLDDLRNVEMVYPRLTNDDFVSFIFENGLPEFISFDNDLGVNENDQLLPDGYAAAKWLVYESGLDLISMKFHVHSANPVASIQIKSLLDNHIQYLKRSKTNR